MKLSDNLKKIRKVNNLSQEQLAEKLGVSRQAVSKWESGQSYPEMDKVLLICKLYNYNIDELMNENVKEVDETKQSKININKYIDEFFSFITKTVDMLSSMKFREKIKCFMEQVFVAFFLLFIFMIIGMFGSGILSTLTRGFNRAIYYYIRDIFEAIYAILAFILGSTVFLHIFKIRYLDYYEIVKDEKENEYDNKENIETKEGVSNKENKVILEKKKEKIIIRDPKHSQSKFLSAILKFIIWCVKVMVGFIAIGFAFSFVVLVTLLILSFLFVKTGIMFVGAFIGITSGLIINFVILEILFNFIISKTNKKHRIAILLLLSMIFAGMGIGLCFIGAVNFNYVEDNNLIEDTYETEMTENIFINNWYDFEFVETEPESSSVKVVVKHSKYNSIEFNHVNDKIEYYVSEENFMELLRAVLKDINNKEIKNYDSFKTYVYASKENIQKMKENKKNYYQKTEEDKNNLLIIDELQDEIVLKEDEIEILNSEVTSLNMEIDSLNKQLESLNN